jgi:hypothetical protein
MEERIYEIDSITSKCYAKLLEVEEKIKGISKLGEHIESTLKSLIPFFSRHTIRSKEACKAFIFMLNNLVFKHSNANNMIIICIKLMKITWKFLSITYQILRI